MRYMACLLCAVAGAPCRADDKSNQYEDQAITRCAAQRAERSNPVGRFERATALRDLEAAYPGKLRKSDPDPEEAADWFALVAGGRDEWRKTDAVAAGLGPMYERWVGRLELGPVPSIKKDEFIRFAKQIISNYIAAYPQGGGAAASTDADADKVFRILDKDGDGELTAPELTLALKEDKGGADADGNGRISKDEYREHFKRKVATKVTAFAAKAGDPAARGPDGKPAGKPGTGLPEWFTSLDEDGDGQISLFEWRQGGKPLALFQAMDPNGDGLLTKEEYLRYVKLKEAEANPKKRP